MYAMHVKAYYMDMHDALNILAPKVALRTSLVPPPAASEAPLLLFPFLLLKKQMPGDVIKAPGPCRAKLMWVAVLPTSETNHSSPRRLGVAYDS